MGIGGDGAVIPQGLYGERLLPLSQKSDTLPGKIYKGQSISLGRLVYDKSSNQNFTNLMKKVKNRIGAGFKEIFQSTVGISTTLEN